MTDGLTGRFEELIARTIGIRISRRDRSTVVDAITARTRALGLPGPEQYLAMLSGSGPRASSEWHDLARIITNGESYFFRDQGQMGLLRRVILPDLIESRRPHRSLKIWSAGCSTGEEAYSLAIILTELIPDHASWHLEIRGTDINPGALEKARRGIYGAWSFRMVDPAVRARYFSHEGGSWRISPSIARMVTFGIANLAAPIRSLPGADLIGFDLILCRNVFIYFDAEAIAMALTTFIGALRQGGCLMTGHGELGTGTYQGLNPEQYPESVVYRRGPEELSRGESVPVVRPPVAVEPIVPAAPVVPAVPEFPEISPIAPPKFPPPMPAPAPPVAARFGVPEGKESSASFADEGERLLRDGRYDKAIEIGEEARRGGRADTPTLWVLARAYANQGRHEAARRCCREIIEREPLGTAPCFLLASIAEEEGDHAAARRHLEGVLYLAPSSVAAYLHLADIAEREGDRRRAVKLRREALTILERGSGGDVVHDYGETRAADLVAHLRRVLESSHDHS